MAKKSIFEGFTNEQLQAMADSAEKTPMGSLLFEERFINPTAVGVELDYDWDSQPREVTDGRALVQSIIRVGLQEMPVLALYAGKDIPEVAEGHRRLDACGIIADEFPDDFARCFPNGVPVRVAIGKLVDNVRTELTQLDIHLMRADHDFDSLKASLGTKIECLRMVAPLFAMGMTMTAVLLHCWRTMSRIMSNKYAALCVEMDNATPAEQVKILNDSQHGNIQFLKALCDTPKCLREAWILGEKGEGPKIPQKVIAKLASEMRTDVKHAKDTVGAKAVDIDSPTDGWVEKFNDAMTEVAKPAADKVKTPGMMKKSKVEEMLDKIKDPSGRLVLQAVLSKEGAERLYFNGYHLDVNAFCTLREAKPRLVEAMLEFGTRDEDITKEQYKALCAVFQPSSVHEEAALEASPKADVKKGKGKAGVKAKAKAKPTPAK